MVLRARPLAASHSRTVRSAEPEASRCPSGAQATVKTQFGKFGEALSAVKEKINQASRKIEDVDVRSRAITKKLRDVEELPSNPQPMLRDLLPNEDDEDLRE